MLKIKPWILWLLASACFIFTGIMHLMEKNKTQGVIFILLGVSYIFLASAGYKAKNKPNKIEVSDEVLKDMDVELRNLIAKDEKINAIKKYRMVTGSGLKEAKEYVDSLSNETGKD